MGQPAVTFDTFWEVYCNLRNKVEVAIPDDIATGFDQSISSEPVGEFALGHLRAPEVDMRNVVDVEDREGIDGDIFTCEFTVDNDRDQLY